MELVPVIDLLGGTVVHARHGDRSRYRPLHSSLCSGSAPEEVVDALMALHPFRSLYVADLDAIQGRTGHQATIARLASRHSGLGLWVDAGVTTPAAATVWLDHGVGTVVVGSESLSSVDDLLAVRAAVPEGRIALSLDRRGGFLGPAGLETDTGLWPDRVILMTLTRVGSGAGPDIGRLTQARIQAPDKRFYAAGGVRAAGDLASLVDVGAAGVLIASALHDGRIGAKEIGRLVAGRQGFAE